MRTEKKGNLTLRSFYQIKPLLYEVLPQQGGKYLSDSKSHITDNGKALKNGSVRNMSFCSSHIFGPQKKGIVKIMSLRGLQNPQNVE